MEFKDETQNDRIIKVIDGLEMSPTEWTIDFEEFNTDSKISYSIDSRNSSKHTLQNFLNKKIMSSVSRSMESGRGSL